MHLTAEKRSHIDCVHTLCLTRSNQVSVEGFPDEELNAILLQYINIVL